MITYPLIFGYAIRDIRTLRKNTTGGGEKYDQQGVRDLHHGLDDGEGVLTRYSLLLGKNDSNHPRSLRLL